MCQKKIALVRCRPPISSYQKAVSTPPIGLWSMRALLRQYGWKVGITAHNVMPPIEPDVIGISCQFSIAHPIYVKTAKLTRQLFPKALIIAGGFHAAAVERPPEIDIVVRGAGEQGLAQYLGYQKPAYDEQPFPEWDDWEMNNYWASNKPHDLISKTRRWMPIETSRGCNGKCRFCGVTKFWGRWVAHSVEYMRELLKTYKTRRVEEVFIEDDNVSRDPKRFEMLIDEFGRQGFAWSVPNGIRTNDLWRMDDLTHLRKTGCWRVSLPFETGSLATARKMGMADKWMPYEQAAELVVRLREADIRTCGFFIIGWPSETIDDMLETLMYANALPLDDRHIYIATPYPGTALYETAQYQGLLLKQPPELYEQLLYGHAIMGGHSWAAEQVEELRTRDRDRAIRIKDNERR